MGEVNCDDRGIAQRQTPDGPVIVPTGQIATARQANNPGYISVDVVGPREGNHKTDKKDAIDPTEKSEKHKITPYRYQGLGGKL